MKFIRFFLIVYTMGTGTQFLDCINNKAVKFIAQILYYVVMASIAYAIFLKFGITTYA